MLAELGSCLLLAVALLGPGPRARAMKGRSSWRQAGMGRREEWAGSSGGPGRFLCGRPESAGHFGKLAEFVMY